MGSGLFLVFANLRFLREKREFAAAGSYARSSADAFAWGLFSTRKLKIRPTPFWLAASLPHAPELSSRVDREFLARFR